METNEPKSLCRHLSPDLPSLLDSLNLLVQSQVDLQTSFSIPQVQPQPFLTTVRLHGRLSYYLHRSIDFRQQICRRDQYSLNENENKNFGRQVSDIRAKPATIMRDGARREKATFE